MRSQDLLEIANAKNRMEFVLGLNKAFLEWLAEHPTAKDVPAIAQVSGNTISVPGFGFVAKADARAARFVDGSFAVEYVFLVSKGAEEIEVSRFYLVDSGNLVAEARSTAAPITSYNNLYVAKFICGQVLLGILHSRLLTAYGEDYHPNIGALLSGA